MPTKVKSQRKKAKAQNNGREVKYPDVFVEICQGDGSGPGHLPAITVEKWKEILGWTEQPEGEDWGHDYALMDKRKKKIRLLNNPKNRPIYTSNVEDLIQELLTKHWSGPSGRGGWTTVNGETVIISRYGDVLNGQHTGCAAILAEQVRTGQESAKWADLWPDSIVMDKIIVYGVDDSDDTVNTMDTAKPRSMSDVFYRSPEFQALKPGDRKPITRYLEYAVKTMMQRTGVSAFGFAPRRTHSNAVEYLNKHARLKQAVKMIWEEDTESSITSLIGGGYEAALQYMMGCSSSDADDYHNGVRTGAASEDLLDWAMWDKATDFWVKFGSKAQPLAPLRAALEAVKSSAGGSLSDRVGLIAKAWRLYAAGSTVTAAGIRLRTEEKDGIDVVVETPDVGGIDLGNPRERTEQTPADPSPEEIAKQAEEIKRKAEEEEKQKSQARKDKRDELLRRRKAEARRQVAEREAETPPDEQTEE
jgi:hypothetical protein